MFSKEKLIIKKLNFKCLKLKCCSWWFLFIYWNNILINTELNSLTWTPIELLELKIVQLWFWSQWNFTATKKKLYINLYRSLFKNFVHHRFKIKKKKNRKIGHDRVEFLINIDQKLTCNLYIHIYKVYIDKVCSINAR